MNKCRGEISSRDAAQAIHIAGRSYDSQEYEKVEDLRPPYVPVDQGYNGTFVCDILQLHSLGYLGQVGESFSKVITLTKLQVPRRMITKKRDKLGVLAGSGLQASSTTVVSFEVAKIGKEPFTGRAKRLLYGWTVL